MLNIQITDGESVMKYTDEAISILYLNNKTSQTDNADSSIASHLYSGAFFKSVTILGEIAERFEKLCHIQ
jgi:hypothetical protein